MASAVQNWGEILRTQNLPTGAAMDTVSRWLLITRASVFPMTITSAAIGGLLAIGAPADKSWVCFALAFVGLVLEYQDQSEAIPIIRSTSNLEYDLILRIDKITRGKEAKVAFQVNVGAFANGSSDLGLALPVSKEHARADAEPVKLVLFFVSNRS